MGTMTGRGDVEQTMKTNHVNASLLELELDRNVECDGGAAGTFGRRRLLAAALAMPSIAALLAACGDNTQGVGANPGTTPSSTGNTTISPNTIVNTTISPNTVVDTTISANTTVLASIDHPTGANDVVVRLGYVGGFVAPGTTFVNVPSLLIAGDGHVYAPGVTTAIFPGPLLPAITVRTITEAGIQRVLAVAEAAHLLATPPDYAAVLNIADAPDTQLILSANGETFVHQAYALGMQDPAETKDRNVFHSVVIQLGELGQLAGAENLGNEEPFVPESFRIQARAVTAEDLAGYTDDPKPTVVPWPATTGVSLADASSCVVVPAAAVGTLFADANQLTFFSSDFSSDDTSATPSTLAVTSTVYSVSVVAMLPGDTC